MNKAELIEAIATAAKLSKAEAGRALDATVDSIAKSLKKGDKVSLNGFGTFSVAERSARTGRNPVNGTTVHIGMKKIAKFKAGTELTRRVNK